MFKIIPAKKEKGLCVACRCSNKRHAPNRFCHKHHKRFQKESNPTVYVFGALKQNARRRGKAFTLTIEQFKDFCTRTGYLRLRGKTGKSASIDRIDPSRGYTADNIQILSLSANSKKGVKDCPF